MRSRLRPYRLIGLLGLTVLAGGATGAGWLFNATHAGTAPVASLAGEPAPAVVCFGHVDMEHGISALYPVLPGRVTAVEVEENQAVKAGTVLLRLDDRAARLRAREAEADLEAAREQLAQARKLPEQQRTKVAQQRAAIEAVEHRLDGARHLLRRKQELARIEQVNANEVAAAGALVQELEAAEQAERSKLRELELNDPQAGVKCAWADVKAKEARLEQASRGVDECLLKAPTDGTVLRILVSPGDVLGAQPREPAVQFCPRGRRIIRAEVEQEFAAQVATGQAVAIQDDATAGPTWRGQVTRISDWYTQRRSILQEPLQFNDVRTLECLIALDPGQPPLRIGQRVRVTIRGRPAA